MGNSLHRNYAELLRECLTVRAQVQAVLGLPNTVSGHLKLRGDLKQLNDLIDLLDEVALMDFDPNKKGF